MAESSKPPAFLSMGFRPFFPLAGLWAGLALVLSVEMIRGRMALPSAFSPVAWHYHEMLFGYVAAAIAGFLLTAIPNWTGRRPVQGMPLLALGLLWVAGRAAVALSGIIGPWTAMIVDLAFLAALLAVAGREILAAGNRRNLPVVGLLALFLVANALSHAAAMDLGVGDALARRLPIAVVIMLILLIGGRIVPNFTRNWLRARDATVLPGEFGWLDRAGLGVAGIALAAWAIAPAAPITGGLAGLAGVLTLLRLGRWRGWATGREPLLIILHIGYLWVGAGFLLLALGAFLPASVPQTAATHALTVGAIGTMTLAVMSRAIFGHTGRALTAGPGLTLAFIAVTLAAILRVAASLWPAIYAPVLSGASIAWLAAFVLFLLVCAPAALSPKPAEH